MASQMCGFTCGGPGFNISCTVDNYILGFSFLGCTQAIPDVNGGVNTLSGKIKFYSHYETIFRPKKVGGGEEAPVSIPKEVESVHG